MRETLDAVFENGTFRPLSPAKVPLAPGQRVRLTVESPVQADQDLIELAAKVYDDLTDEQVDEIERLALDRSNFFGGDATDEPARSAR
jgi:predicted DNA-binding antitoxin AbrB/MazE fold protein